MTILTFCIGSASKAGRRAALAALALAALLFGGCAAGTAWDYAEDPGVPVSARLADGTAFSARLVGLSDGSLVVDRSIPRSERLEVVRRRGREVVVEDGRVIGTPRDARGHDLVVRQRIPFAEFEDLRVATRAYFGWGSIIAAGLAYLAVTVVKDL